MPPRDGERCFIPVPINGRHDRSPWGVFGRKCAVQISQSKPVRYESAKSHSSDENESIPIDNRPGMRLIHELYGHEDRVIRPSWSPNGRYLATPSDDGTVRIWEGNTGQCQQILGEHPAEVGVVAWIPHSKSIMIGCANGKIYQWELNGNIAKNRNHRWSRVIDAHSGVVRSIVWSFGFFISGGDDAMVKVWDPVWT